MKIFRTYKFKWWRISFLKLFVLAIGILIGACYPIFFKEVTFELVGIVVVLALYFLYAAITRKI